MIRSVELTDNSVVIDGRDISNLVTGVDLHIRADQPWPYLSIDMAPDAILYSGPAEVAGVPLDGIARLRERLRQRHGPSTTTP